MYVFQLIDWYSAAIAVPLFGFFECIVFGWIYGKDSLNNWHDFAKGDKSKGYKYTPVSSSSV